MGSDLLTGFTPSAPSWNANAGGADTRQGRIVDQVTPTTLILVTVLVSSVLAYVPAAIAESKGYNHTTWYWYGFFLSLIALIHVAVLSPTLEAVDDPLGEQRS